MLKEFDIEIRSYRSDWTAYLIIGNRQFWLCSATYDKGGERSRPYHPKTVGEMSEFLVAVRCLAPCVLEDITMDLECNDVAHGYVWWVFDQLAKQLGHWPDAGRFRVSFLVPEPLPHGLLYAARNDERTNLSAADLRAVYRYWYTLRVARMYDASPRNYLAAVFRENMAAHFNVTREEYFAIVDSETQAIRADYDKWVTMAKTD